MEIFEENFKKYPKFSEEEAKRIAKKWGFTGMGISKIVREIDEICFQVGNTEEELKKNRFELGILDPNYQDNKELGTHARIKFCVEKELDAKIDYGWEQYSLKGILCEDEKGLRYLICGLSDENSKYLVEQKIQKNSEFSEKLKIMLERYNIAELFLGKAEHNKEINERILHAQLSTAEGRDAYFKERKKEHPGD